MRIATGFERLAMELEEYIKFYKPNGLREPIHEFDSAPLVSDKEAKCIYDAHKNGTLHQYLEKAGSQFSKWYVSEAIEDFFKKGEHLDYIEDA